MTQTAQNLKRAWLNNEALTINFPCTPPHQNAGRNARCSKEHVANLTAVKTAVLSSKLKQYFHNYVELIIHF
jgi:hypothetical protein